MSLHSKITELSKKVNILLFCEQDLNPQNPNQILIRDQRATHVREILKLQVGQPIRVGRINGLSGVATLATNSADEIRLDLSELNEPPPEASPVELILALPRPKSLKRTLRAVANLGIKSIHLINSYRVEKPYWTAPVLEPEMMKSALLDGLSIARDTILPTVRLHRLFKPFVQDVAPHLVEGDAFVAHPSSAGNVSSAPFRTTSQRVPLAIGPEGGFTDYEVGLFREAGFQTLSLGSRIYSVECAVPVLEAILRAHRA
ncbi:16S rRNA (uracil(1498)-N(3))-methyltransferase [soil metagenome]